MRSRKRYECESHLPELLLNHRAYAARPVGESPRTGSGQRAWVLAWAPIDAGRGSHAELLVRRIPQMIVGAVI